MNFKRSYLVIFKVPLSGGKGVHIVTVNEYLAKRDYEKMSKVFNFLGLSVGLNISGLSIEEKKKAYNFDITYTSNSELGFDYLRDNLVYKVSDKVQRGLNYAIIDEVDSVLIDDALTPLVISSKSNNSLDNLEEVDRAIKLLIENEDIEINDNQRSFCLTNVGIKKLEKMFNIKNLYDENNSYLNHLVRQSIIANYILKKDVDYIVNKDDEVMIIDSSTGRTMEGRKWSNELHGAVEAKECVMIHDEDKTSASITYQNFFRQYNKLSGMSGTCSNEEEEFLATYNMFVYKVPCANKVIRIDDKDRVYKSEKLKYKALIDEVCKIHKSGRPILIGTSSIENSLKLSKLLNEKGIKHNVLNALNDKLEADIIKEAGEAFAVTIATNMAGRGTDIKLSNDALLLGGLAVLGSERFSSKRVDDQLRGRSGRQGDPGYSCFFDSLEDELFIKYGNKDSNSKNILKLINNAQAICEGEKYNSRKSLLKYDEIIRDLRNIIYASRDEILKCNNIHDFIVETIVLTVKRIVENSLNGKSYIDLIISNKICMDCKELTSTNIIASNLIGMDSVTCINYISGILVNKFELIDFNVLGDIEKDIVLKYIDNMWSEYIEDVDDLKANISLRSYAQADPLKEYKEDAYKLFDNMLDRLDRAIISCFLRMKIVAE